MKKVIPLLALGLSACMGELRNADLRPTVTISKAAEGRGGVALNVVDERPSTAVADMKSGGGNIRLPEAGPLVEPSVKQALLANGFTPAEKGETVDRRLKIEIRAIDLKIAGGIASSSWLPSTALKAVASNKGQVFERFYRAENTKSVVMGTTDEEKDRMVSDVLSKALTDLTNDPELMGFLAR